MLYALLLDFCLSTQRIHAYLDCQSCPHRPRSLGLVAFLPSTGLLGLVAFLHSTGLLGLVAFLHSTGLLGRVAFLHSTDLLELVAFLHSTGLLGQVAFLHNTGLLGQVALSTQFRLTWASSNLATQLKNTRVISVALCVQRYVG